MIYTKKYVNYLKSNRWQKKREKKLKQVNYKCKWIEYGDCEGSLHVHHLHYNTLGRENLWDLMVLCESHHAQADEERKVKLWARKVLGVYYSAFEDCDISEKVWEAWECRDLEFENDYNEDS